jgi:hypothetical protein
MIIKIFSLSKIIKRSFGSSKAVIIFDRFKTFLKKSKKMFFEDKKRKIVDYFIKKTRTLFVNA